MGKTAWADKTAIYRWKVRYLIDLYSISPPPSVPFTGSRLSESLNSPFWRRPSEETSKGLLHLPCCLRQPRPDQGRPPGTPAWLRGSPLPPRTAKACSFSGACCSCAASWPTGGACWTVAWAAAAAASPWPASSCVSGAPSQAAGSPPHPRGTSSAANCNVCNV